MNTTTPLTYFNPRVLARPFTIFVLAITYCLSLQSQTEVLVEADNSNRPPLPSSVFTPPPPPKEVPPIMVEAATMRKMQTHQITVLRGEPSTLADIPPPPEPATKQSFSGPVGEPNYLLSFGATVYDNQISHVKWFDPRTKESFEAWCAWDWTLLSPISNIKLGERVQPFCLISSNIITINSKGVISQRVAPKHPTLANNSFTITKGDVNNANAILILTSLRDYYIKNKDRLVQIRQAREDYQAASDAWHKANPPKPQNHTFWLKPHRGSRYLKEEGGER